MPVYEYRCRCGARFERFEPLSAAAGPIHCPVCGAAEARRVPSPFARLGVADPGPDRSAWPTSWEALGHGDRETIARWQRIVDRRLELERRNPELAPPPPQPVASHEHHHHHPYRGPISAPPPGTGTGSSETSPGTGRQDRPERAR